MEIKHIRLYSSVLFAMILACPELTEFLLVGDGFSFLGLIFVSSFLCAYFIIFTTKHMFLWTFAVKPCFKGWVKLSIKIGAIGFLVRGGVSLAGGNDYYYSLPLWWFFGILGTAAVGGFFLVYVSVYYVLLHRSKKVKVRRVIKDERVA